MPEKDITEYEDYTFFKLNGEDVASVLSDMGIDFESLTNDEQEEILSMLSRKVELEWREELKQCLLDRAAHILSKY